MNGYVDRGNRTSRGSREASAAPSASDDVCPQYATQRLYSIRDARRQYRLTWLLLLLPPPLLLLEEVEEEDEEDEDGGDEGEEGCDGECDE